MSTTELRDSVNAQFRIRTPGFEAVQDSEARALPALLACLAGEQCVN